MDPEIQALALALIPDAERAQFEGGPAVGQRCQGLGKEICIFGTLGQRMHVRDRSFQCLFCDVARLAAMCGSDGGPARVAAKIKKQTAQAQRRSLEERVPLKHWEAVRAALEPRALRGRTAAAMASEPGQADARSQLQSILGKRKYVSAEVSEDMKKSYREAMLADRAYARRQMQLPAARHPRGAPVDNDTGLPLPKRSWSSTIFKNHKQCAACQIGYEQSYWSASELKMQKARRTFLVCKDCRGKGCTPRNTHLYKCTGCAKEMGARRVEALGTPTAVAYGYPETSTPPPIRLGDSHKLVLVGGFAGCLRCGSVVGFSSSKLLERDCRRWCPQGSQGPLKRLLKGDLLRPNNTCKSWPSGELSPTVLAYRPAGPVEGDVAGPSQPGPPPKRVRRRSCPSAA